jgi:methyl-accepting chemotaxis protein
VVTQAVLLASRFERGETDAASKSPTAHTDSIIESIGTDLINNAIQGLNQVTQQSAAASEELATSAEEMASQAELLKDSISCFRIR